MIIRKIKNADHPYTMINNWCLRDPLLSAKAKGIFAYIMSLPDDWVFYASELENHFTDGRDAISNGLKELEKSGYLRRDAVRDNGRFKSLDYTFFETPERNTPQTAFPVPVKPISDNPQLLNTKSLLNTDSTKEFSKENNSPSLQTLLNQWNTNSPADIPRCNGLSKTRKTHLAARIAEGMDLSEIMFKIRHSSFLQGKNDRGWKVKLDWVIKNDLNWRKIMEGDYDDKEWALSPAQRHRAERLAREAHEAKVKELREKIA